MEQAASIYTFLKHTKFACYRVLNERHQKRSGRHRTYLRIRNYRAAEPHFINDIWNRKPTLV